VWLGVTASQRLASPFVRTSRYACVESSSDAVPTSTAFIAIVRTASGEVRGKRVLVRESRQLSGQIWRSSQATKENAPLAQAVEDAARTRRGPTGRRQARGLSERTGVRGVGFARTKPACDRRQERGDASLAPRPTPPPTPPPRARPTRAVRRRWPSTSFGVLVRPPCEAAARARPGSSFIEHDI